MSSEAVPVAVMVYGTRVYADWLHWMIRLVQGGWPAHVGLAFRMSDGRCHKYEAKFREGFTGPADMEPYLRRYVRSWYRRIDTRPLPLERPQVAAVWERARRLRDESLGYGKTQLLAKMGHELRDWPMQEDGRLVDCSEGVAICLAAAGRWWDCRRLGHPNFDSVTPVELWRFVNGVLAVQAGKGVRG